jgi:hypothetical protein
MQIRGATVQASTKGASIVRAFYKIGRKGRVSYGVAAGEAGQ